MSDLMTTNDDEIFINMLNEALQKTGMSKKIFIENFTGVTDLTSTTPSPEPDHPDEPDFVD